MEDLVELMAVLRDIYPIDAKQTKTNLDLNLEKIQNCVLLIALVLFVVALVLVAWHKLIIPLEIHSNIPREWVVILIQIFGLFILIPYIVSSSVWIFNIQSDDFRLFELEMEHDKRNVDKLVEFSERLLMEAQTWFQIKSERIKGRVGLFFEHPEKMAFFSLAGIGWTVWKNFSGNDFDVRSFLVTDDLGQIFFTLVLALLVGFALGSILTKLQLRRYAYYLVLIELTLERKNGHKRIPKIDKQRQENILHTDVAIRRRLK